MRISVVSVFLIFLMAGPAVAEIPERALHLSLSFVHSGFNAEGDIDGYPVDLDSYLGWDGNTFKGVSLDFGSKYANGFAWHVFASVFQAKESSRHILEASEKAVRLDQESTPIQGGIGLMVYPIDYSGLYFGADLVLLGLEAKQWVFLDGIKEHEDGANPDWIGGAIVAGYDWVLAEKFALNFEGRYSATSQQLDTFFNNSKLDVDMGGFSLKAGAKVYFPRY